MTPVVVTLSGPGHHERADAAVILVSALHALGMRVGVSSDLRPRLADDMGALLDAGAGRVLLVGGRVTAVTVHDDDTERARERRYLEGADVVVRLVAGPGPMLATVEESGLADRAMQAQVREVLATVALQ